MHNWAKFCDIKQINNKTKNLVADNVARFFLQNDNLSKLKNFDMYLVPPCIDGPRKLHINAVKQQNNKKIEISVEQNNYNSSTFSNSSLICDMNDMKDIYGDMLVCYSDDEYIGFEVYDKVLGFVGCVEDIGGTQAQMHFIVGKDDTNFIMPFVSEIVKKVEDKKIYVELPKGLIDINN